MYFHLGKEKRKNFLLDDDLFSTCGVAWTHLFFFYLIPRVWWYFVSGRFIYDSRSACVRATLC